ncbi:hypothetical protein Droror1_Dr00023934 [Drosera rotundifolia]
MESKARREEETEINETLDATIFNETHGKSNSNRQRCYDLKEIHKKSNSHVLPPSSSASKQPPPSTVSTCLLLEDRGLADGIFAYLFDQYSSFTSTNTSWWPANVKNSSSGWLGVAEAGEWQASAYESELDGDADSFDLR